MKLTFPPKKPQVIIGINSFIIAFAAHMCRFIFEFGSIRNGFDDVLIRIIHAIQFPTLYLLDGMQYSLGQFEIVESFLYWIIPSTIWLWLWCNVFWAPYHYIKNKIVFPSAEMQILFLTIGAAGGYLFSSYFQITFFTWFFGNIIWMIRNYIKNRTRIGRLPADR